MVTSTVTNASEGMKYAAAYMCDPARVTRAAAEICAKRLSDHSSRYWSEYHAWLERNGTAILRLRAECASELKTVASDDAQLRDMIRQMDDVNTETIAAMINQNAEAVADVCTNLLSGMQTKSSDLNRHFPSRK